MKEKTFSKDEIIHFLENPSPNNPSLYIKIKDINEWFSIEHDKPSDNSRPYSKNDIFEFIKKKNQVFLVDCRSSHNNGYLTLYKFNNLSELKDKETKFYEKISKQLEMEDYYIEKNKNYNPILSGGGNSGFTLNSIYKNNHSVQVNRAVISSYMESGSCIYKKDGNKKLLIYQYKHKNSIYFRTDKKEIPEDKL